MATGPRPANDPYMHLTAMVGQLTRAVQTILSQMEQVGTGFSEVRIDSRALHTTVLKQSDVLRTEMGNMRSDVQGRIGALHSDMLARFADVMSRFDDVTRRFADMMSRFEAVGLRFDASDAALERIEREIRAMHNDIIRLENGVLNAQQSALQAHQRIDDMGGSTPKSP